MQEIMVNTSRDGINNDTQTSGNGNGIKLNVIRELDKIVLEKLKGN